MDARIRYTKMVIKDSLFELMKTREFGKITVKEICDKAQINRATFYRYYDNPYDLIDKIETEVLDEIEKTIQSNGYEAFQDVFRFILSDIKKRKEYYNLMFSENGDDRFREKLYSLCYGSNMKEIKKIFSGMDEARQDWVYYFIAEGCNGILHKWIRGGMKESEEYVVSFTEKMIDSINKNFA